MLDNPGLRLALCALPLLVSCTQFAQIDQSPRVQPFFRVSNSLGSAHGYYLLGAYYDGQNRLDQAETAYRQAIEIDPDAVDARNALAMLHSARHQYDEAITELEKAVRKAPTVAKLHNNLGYVYYLNKDHAGAINEFRLALALDPYHALALNNLEASCDQLDVFARERVVLLTPDPLRHTRSGPCAAPANVSLAGVDGAAPASAPLSTLLDRVIMKVKQATHFLIAQPEGRVPDEVVAAPAAQPTFRLEIANGNGAVGLARRMRDALQQEGGPPPRLTNLKPFTQRETVIQFRAGFEEAARSLSLQLSAHPVQLVAADITPASDVRLILGHDIAAGSDLIVTAGSAAARDAGKVTESAAHIAAKPSGREIAQR